MRNAATFADNIGDVPTVCGWVDKACCAGILLDCDTGTYVDDTDTSSKLLLLANSGEGTSSEPMLRTLAVDGGDGTWRRSPDPALPGRDKLWICCTLGLLAGGRDTVANIDFALHSKAVSIVSAISACCRRSCR